jgi:hypothetical protein
MASLLDANPQELVGVLCLKQSQRKRTPASQGALLEETDGYRFKRSIFFSPDAPTAFARAPNAARAVCSLSRCNH